jgi:hypothetical protein
MRLWNLVTGKKAGVLVFGRDVLKQVGEGRWGGEGRRLAWAASGEEFAVAWERGAVIYGLVCGFHQLLTNTYTLIGLDAQILDQTFTTN